MYPVGGPPEDSWTSWLSGYLPNNWSDSALGDCIDTETSLANRVRVGHSCPKAALMRLRISDVPEILQSAFT
jgi:hypothetical protein